MDNISVFTPYKIVSLLDMLKLSPERFMQITGFLYSLKDTYSNNPDFEIPLKTRDDFIIIELGDLQEICSSMGLSASARQASRVAGLLLGHANSSKNLLGHIKDLINRLYDELNVAFCFIIPKGNETYYTETQPFGVIVNDCFPSAISDIEEASKCFALARYTACVMHLQRVLETGLKGFGHCLGIMTLISTTQPSWNLVLDKTRKEIKEYNDASITTKTWGSPQKKEFCESLQALLEAVKVAWRNPSMHVDRTYNEEEAQDIFNAVKGFMRYASEHMDEKGKFVKTRKKKYE